MGVTTTLVPVTVPTPWSIESVVAPVTTQARVEEPPREMVDGVAVKEVNTGSGALVTVTRAECDTEPAALVAVMV